MKDNHFEVKVSDLLRQIGKEDSIDFVKKFSDQLPNLDKNGISGKFTISALNDSSLFAKLTDVKCKLTDICDVCTSDFLREVHVDSYVAKFVLEDSIEAENKDSSDDPIFIIDSKSENINIEDMVVQSILLNEPFVKRCESCNKQIEESSTSTDEDGEYFETKSNIVFR